MTHTNVFNSFTEAVDHVVRNIDDFVTRPGIDFTRKNKLPPEKLIPFLVTQGAGSTRNELTEAFDFSAKRPSAPALSQQRAKLKPQGIADVFYRFNEALDSLHPPGKYRFLAVDGSTITYSSREGFSPPEFFSTQGNSSDGCYSIHAIASLDVDTNMYTDCVLQPIKQKDEYGALAAIIDRHPVPAGTSLVFLADRGFCSYNNMAHAIEHGCYFLFRAKDIHSKGLLHHIDLPSSETFDIDLNLVIIRKRVKSRKLPEGYVRYINRDTSFDFVEYGSPNYYELSFRAVRLELSQGNFECLVTNLPREEFTAEDLKELYHRRWGEETSFRALKYTVGLLKFHSIKSDYVLQEIWARLIIYNFTWAVVSCAVIEQDEGNKHTYKVNFSCAVHICRKFLRVFGSGDQFDVIALLLRELIPLRDGRQYPRLKTAHFRRPPYFLYRPS
jgi:hypothetical protein